MEALNFLRFWRPITSTTTTTTTSTTTINTDMPNLVVETLTQLEDAAEEAEEDSFFELELAVPDYDSNRCTTTTCEDPVAKDRDGGGVDQADSDQHKQNAASFSHSHGDILSKRKILPISELSSSSSSSSSRPQSPISLLKSAPRFRVLMFRKSKSTSTAPQRSEAGRAEMSNGGGSGNNLFTLKFKVKEIRPAFTRAASSRRSGSASLNRSLDSLLSADDDSGFSKRFSKDVIQKYLRLVKPLYVKVSRKQSEDARLSGEAASAVSALLSPTLPARKGLPTRSSPAGFAAVSKRLGKSKSASATGTATSAGVVWSSPARRDDSLVQQHDGIQGAILHCKRSFNSSSRELSPLSRSSSGPPRENSLDSGRGSNEYSKDGRSVTLQWELLPRT